MQRFEYQVVPAPRKGEKAKAAKTAPERFAVALTHVMNDMAAQGWEYVRSDTLPCEERVGFTGKTTVFQNMLVFRREIAVVDAVSQQALPVESTPVVAAPVIAASRAELATPEIPSELRVNEALRVGGPQLVSGRAPALGPANPHHAAE